MSNSLSDVNTAVEQLGHGVTREWIQDHQIVIFTLKDFSRPSIDTWIKATKETIDHRPGETFYILHDHSTSGILVLTPYARERAKELTTHHPDVPTYVALIVPKTFITQLFVYFMSTQKRAKSMLKLFFSREKGLAWLNQMMAKPH